MKTILFDIDGTLADIKHRRLFLEQENPDWKLFNSSMEKDVPNAAIVELYKILWESGKYELILVTGRNEKYREITEKWLALNQIPFGIIKMRLDGDFRPDHTIKEGVLNALISEGKEILFVVDDRRQVVDMWRRNGLMCLQCDEGDY